MKSFGQCDVVERWIEAYLSERVLRIGIGGELLGTTPIRSGVRQGSVMNDLQDALEVLTPYMMSK